MSDVQFDVALLLGFEQIEGSSFGNEEECSEFKRTFIGEVLGVEVFLPIVGEGFVEGGLFVLGNFLGRSNPDGPDFV